MIKTEKQLWQKLKRDFKCWPHIRFTRIETSTKNGVPDVFFTNGTINGWIELKVFTVHSEAIFSADKFKLSVNQINWLNTTPNSYVLAMIYFFDKTDEPQYILLLSIEGIYKLHGKYSWSKISFEYAYLSHNLVYIRNILESEV